MPKCDPSMEAQKWIRLVGLKLNVSIGIHEFERCDAQPYKLDIGLQLVNSYRAVNDAITETVDYDRLRALVSKHLISKHFNLQETAIQDVVAICFNLDERIIGVDVATAKTSVYPDCDAVGLHYVIARGEWLSELDH